MPNLAFHRTAVVCAALALAGAGGCDGTMEPLAGDPGTAPAPTGVEQTGQEALGTGGTDLGRFYRLKSAVSGTNLCLDVSGNSQSDNGVVLQFTCGTNKENQLWYARQASSAPEYQLSAKHSAKCLRTENGGTGSGVKIVQYRCLRTLAEGLDSTRLTLTQIGTTSPPRYQIKIKAGGKCIRSPNTTSGAQLTAETCGTGTNFQWIFEQQAFLGDSNTNGNWTAPATIPLIPAAAALLPNRKVLVWSSWKPYRFAGTGSLDQTVMALVDPANPGAATARTITNTTHNMFCPGIAMLPNGDVFVNGGDDSHTKTTSIYHWQTDTWSRPAAMVESRWYNSSITMPDGRVFTLAGNRTGGTGRTGTGEVWNGSTWSFQSQATITDMMAGQLVSARAMEHPRLHIAPNGRVFVSGPSTRMQWFDPGNGFRWGFAGLRSDDEASNNDITVMFDVNVNTGVAKILKAGGNPSYDRPYVIDPNPEPDITVAANYANANHNSYVITLNGGAVSIAKTAPIKWPRTFGNGVVLANGQVVAVGGLDNGKGFSDDGNIRPAELFDPATNTWKELSAMDKPRPYHSVGLLLDDGRVLVGGGGLCSNSENCAVNHPDIEILSPPYLYSATRPGQPGVQTTITTGTTNIPVTVSGMVTGFSLVRLAGVTHSTNTDQRYMRLNFSNLGGGNYTINAPPNKNLAPPGYYMLFALNGQAPSTRAAMVRIQ